MTNNLVVVGGGQAAFALAAKLRALKDQRPITVIASENSLPYQRPPLSKKYLMGEAGLDRLHYRPQSWYVDNDIDIRTGTRAVRIERADKSLSLSGGVSLPYETLVLATGSRPRRLLASVGGELEGVYVIRDFQDADKLASDLKPGKRALVIGGGYIGLEAAAVARTAGLDVVLIEMADRILNRVASSTTADIVRDIHRVHGVDIREATGLVRLVGERGRVTHAELTDGTTLSVDLVIVGIGVHANDELAVDANLTVENGVVVDEFSRTSDPSIYAIGDCAVMPWEGRRIRLESVQNAVDQSETLAQTLAGTPRTYAPKPWFWSDQYDVKLQIAGFGIGYDSTITRPGQREGSVSVWYMRAGKLIAVDAINDARAYVAGKKMIEMGITPERAEIENPATDLKLLLG